MTTPTPEPGPRCDSRPASSSSTAAASGGGAPLAAALGIPPMMLAAIKPQAEAAARAWFDKATDAELRELASHALSLHPRVRELAMHMVAAK